MKQVKQIAFPGLAFLLLFSTFFNCSVKENDPSMLIQITPETGSTNTEFYFSASPGFGCNGPLYWRIYDENMNKIELGDDEGDQSFYRKFEAAGNYTAIANTENCSDTKTFRVVEDLGEIPVAVMQVTPLAGDPSTIFEFDASQSHDAQTPIADLLVRWDWTSDGTWDVTY
jgi:hypothetical protein